MNDVSMKPPNFRGVSLRSLIIEIQIIGDIKLDPNKGSNLQPFPAYIVFYPIKVVFRRIIFS